MSAVPVGVHVAGADPLQAAEETGADLVQFFLGNPQSWRKPPPRADADRLRASALPLYVHSNYLVNVCSDNNRVRIPSRKNLADMVAAAEDIGAEAVIVHGGHVGDEEDNRAVGVERWVKALEPLDSDLLVVIENTAGGGNAVAREIDNYGPLWEGIGHLNVGVCLDTCHAWAAGEDLETVVDRLMAATGRIDLVHCNDSRDPHNSRRDRHTNLGTGMIPWELIIGVVQAASAPVVIETPDDAPGLAADIAWLRERLGS